MKTKLKVLVAGAGYMGDTHAGHYSKMEHVEVLGIIDKNEIKGKSLASKYNCNYFTELKDALVPEADFVDVCLPTLFHKEVIVESFQAGKHVICEKPLSLNSHDAEEIAEASRKYHCKLMVAHVVRFWPEYVKLADMIKNKEIDHIKQFTLTRYGPRPDWSEGNWMLSDKKSGGIIYDLTIHDIDYAIYLFGMPKWVFASKSKIGEDYTAYVNAILGYPQVNVLLESGFVMARTYPFTTGFRLSNGDVSLEYINKTQKGLLMYSTEIDSRELSYDDFDPYAKELSYFVECLLNGKDPEQGSGEDALKAVKVAEYIETSANNNKRVEVV